MSSRFNANDYDYYVDKYKEESKKAEKPLPCSKLSSLNLPKDSWYVDNCPDENVCSWAEFVKWCGFPARKHPLSKEETTNLIYKMQKTIKRPLIYDDFRGVNLSHPSILTIKKYWGTFNNMKKDLGLAINQDSMLEKSLTKEQFDTMITDICDYVKKDNRDFITTSEIDCVDRWNNSQCLRKYAQKYYGLSLTQMFCGKGIRLGKQGRGLTFDFSDGEHVTSQFEYLFSKMLRKHGLEYNHDYFRDVKYSLFIPGYEGNMNCDYVIKIGEKVLYIEIAGIIEVYKTWFFQDKPISNRKSREQYRIKLTKKMKMLNENNLKYFILFPCDLTESNVSLILSDGSVALRKKIEKFVENNIDWIKVRKIGELRYNKQ